MPYAILLAVVGAFLALPVFGVAWVIAVGLRSVRPHINYRRVRYVFGLSLSILVALTFALALPHGGWHFESAILLAAILPAYAVVEWMAQGGTTGSADTLTDD